MNTPYIREMCKRSVDQAAARIRGEGPHDFATAMADYVANAKKYDQKITEAQVSKAFGE